MRRHLYLYVKAFSDMGTMMDMIVLTSLILAATHSNLWVSLSFITRTAGGLLSSLLSGVMADRMSRRRLMIISDIVRAGSIFAIILSPGPWMIVIASFVVGFFSSYFAVSFGAEVPQMFGEDKVLETNALISRLSAISMVVGFIASGVLTHLGGYTLVLALDALSYVFSAAALTILRWEHGSPKQTADPAVSAGPRQSLSRIVGGDLVEVAKYLWGIPVLLVISVGYLVETYGAASHNVGVPLLAEVINPNNQTMWYGVIWGIWAVGGVCATVLIPYLKQVKRNIYVTYWMSTIFMSCGFITFLSNTNPVWILPFAFLTGIFDATSGTLYNTIMQQCDNRVRGRVFGVSTLINRLGFLIGFVVVPILLNHMSMPHMVWVLHGTVITFTLASLIVGLRYLKGGVPTLRADTAVAVGD